mmetsp:Transcript_16052/g.29419  ORF Transcript_16052/g.29419 Transcript_16052/m.29419 type:complete len:122 (+) Transcript_16052:670-1035(+)
MQAQKFIKSCEVRLSPIVIRLKQPKTSYLRPSPMMSYGLPWRTRQRLSSRVSPFRRMSHRRNRTLEPLSSRADPLLDYSSATVSAHSMDITPPAYKTEISSVSYSESPPQRTKRTICIRLP